MPDFNSMTNFIWLMNNNGGRYDDMPISQNQVAIDLNVRPEWVTRRKNGELPMSAEIVAKLLDGKKFKQDHPQFQDTWLSWEPRKFAREMVSLGYGWWDGYQALDDRTAAVLPPLAQSGVIGELALAQLLARGPQRADVGWHVAPDIPVTAEIGFGRRFGVSVQEPPLPLASAVAAGYATTLLLNRTLNARAYVAVQCPQAGSTHLMTLDWEPPMSVPVRQRPRDPKLQLVIAKPEGHPLRTTYGFCVPSTPQRIELVVAVFGRIIPDLREWSELGGMGSPLLNEALLRNLVGDTPKVAGRMLVDIVRTPSA